MNQQKELVVITKTYDLILWTCNHTNRFPRNQRFVLGERIERGLYDLLETLIANKKRQLSQIQSQLADFLIRLRPHSKKTLFLVWFVFVPRRAFEFGGLRLSSPRMGQP